MQSVMAEDGLDSVVWEGLPGKVMAEQRPEEGGKEP